MPTSDIYNPNPLNINLKAQIDSEPKIINDKAIQKIRFNVMTDRHVEEILYIKEYRLWDNAIEAIFDREYYTEMTASPNHLIFLSALVNLQKMVYVYMHHYLGLDYLEDKVERIKIWPTDLNLNMPKMIFDSNQLCHRMDIKSVKYVGDNKYYIIADTNVNNTIKITIYRSHFIRFIMFYGYVIL